MDHSATARLITQPAPISSALLKLTRRTGDQFPGHPGQHLRACAQPDRIRTGHPGTVADHVPAPDGDEAIDDGEDHARPKQEPQGIEQQVAPMPSVLFVPG